MQNFFKFIFAILFVHKNLAVMGPVAKCEVGTKLLTALKTKYNMQTLETA